MWHMYCRVGGMMNENANNPVRILRLSILILLSTAVQAGAMQVAFVARLANFDNIVPSLWSRVAVDKERTELIALNPRQRDIRIFDQNGMEIFTFGDDVELAGATDLDIGEEGDIYLTYPRGDYKVLRLDYKGEPLAFVDLSNVPADFTPFNPQIIQYLDGRLYLADTLSFDVVVTDSEGVFERGYHLKDALAAMVDELGNEPGGDALSDPEQFKAIDMFGFCADRDGNLFFTVPVLFSAFKYTVDGKLKSFGRAGSGPGKFGVVAGITTDNRGNIYITDRLRSVVMIFNSNFEFQMEFGYRGVRPGNLIVPDDITVDDEKGFVYVAQAAKRGVSVYRITDY